MRHDRSRCGVAKGGGVAVARAQNKVAVQCALGASDGEWMGPGAALAESCGRTREIATDVDTKRREEDMVTVQRQRAADAQGNRHAQLSDHAAMLPTTTINSTCCAQLTLDLALKSTVTDTRHGVPKRGREMDIKSPEPQIRVFELGTPRKDR